MTTVFRKYVLKEEIICSGIEVDTRQEIKHKCGHNVILRHMSYFVYPHYKNRVEG